MADDLLSQPHVLRKGGNLSLSDLGAELGGITVYLDSRGPSDAPVDADVGVLLLGETGKVRSSDDFVFYNQPIALGGAVHLRDKVRPNGDTEDEAGWSSDVVTIELDDIPDEVHRIVVSASLDPAGGATFGQVLGLRMRVQRTSDAVDLLTFDIEDTTEELAIVFGELYRRSGAWRVRAVGQGYAGGLSDLVTAHGIEVDAELADGPAPDPQLDETAAAPTDETSAFGADDSTNGAEEPQGVGESRVAPAPAPLPRTRTGLSVRRPTRAPRLPADWNASIPASDGNDWQPARLFPVAGIGAGEEQERRATSALLAVMTMVREFGAALVSKCGGPRGAITTYIEVPFGQDEEAYRPDGVIQVTRGQRTWTALVEVKTSSGRLDLAQIDHYVEIARARGYDAVLTISSELAGGDADHPVAIDRRKLRKVALRHLSWDQIRTEAILTSRHRGVPDATQAAVLDEFIRYMAHARSGMGGLVDMGSSWVKVRESVKAKTARARDRATGEVSARFDELVQHLGHHMSGLLGVEVVPLTPKETPDHASRRQQLADSGLLFGRLKVPGAVDAIVVGADLRSDRAMASITVQAPRGETRPQTRINWLLRQIPDDAKDSLRIEAHLAGPRSASTAALLNAARKDPACLLPAEQREIRSFTISLDLPLGAKRASGTGTLISSVKSVTTTFYADVVQNLKPWVDQRSPS
jgi:stress response protein SCP2